MKFKHLVIAIILLCATAPGAKADYFPPFEFFVSTKEHSPARIVVHPGTYHYDVSWQGIPVASAEVAIQNIVHDGRSVVKVETKARTTSVIDLLYRMRHDGESIFSVAGFRPIRFINRTVENSREKGSWVSFEDSEKVVGRSWRGGKKPDEVSFPYTNQTLDPISAAFLARSIPIELGTKAQFDVFNGKNRYLITFKVMKIEEVNYGEKTVKAFKVVPSVDKLTDTDGEKRLKSATIWISADDNRDIIRMESKVLVGKVSAKLINFVPQSGQSAAGS